MIRVSTKEILAGNWVGKNRFPGITPKSALEQLDTIEVGRRVPVQLAEIVTLSIPEGEIIEFSNGGIYNNNDLRELLSVEPAPYFMIRQAVEGEIENFDIGQADAWTHEWNQRSSDVRYMPFEEKIVPKDREELMKTFESIPNDGQVEIFDRYGARTTISKTALSMLLFRSGGGPATAFLGHDDRWYVCSQDARTVCTIEHAKGFEQMAQLIENTERYHAAKEQGTPA